MAFNFKISKYVLMFAMVTCTLAYNANRGAGNIYPQFPITGPTYPAQHYPVPGQFYSQYGPHISQLPVTHAQMHFPYPSKPVAYPVQGFPNPFGNFNQDPHAKVVAKSVLYSVLLSSLVNRIG